MLENFRPLKLILLVDDDATTNFVNQRLIRNSGLADHVDIALNGQEALNYLANRNPSAGQHTPEAIFLDVRMPVMNGFEFLAQYSHLADEQRAKVLFILSSAASSFDRERLQGLSGGAFSPAFPGPSELDYSAGGTISCAGQPNTKRVPRPSGPVSTRTSPPLSRTILRTMARPTPVLSWVARWEVT